MRRLLPALVFSLLACASFAQTAKSTSLSRLLANVTDGTSRFHILRQAHLNALATGDTIDYRGIDTLRLDIPTDAQPIPLGLHNDFANTVFIVNNTSKDIFLFALTLPMQPLAIGLPDSILSAAIDSGDFTPIPHLDHGRWLLSVVDSTPWVHLRTGHTYGHYRQELLRLENGHSLDRPAMPYCGTVSRPRLIGRPVTDTSAFLFSRLTLLRDSLSTCKTFLLNLENICRATIAHVTVVTPASTLVDDRIIRIYNCADIMLDSLTILGSYSQPDRSGYGLLMDNCRDTRVLHLTARTPWGLFGTNNMHNTLFDHCRFDRFDIHCYGRNVTYRHCQQTDSYNQYSSVYGTILHDSCTFDNFTPLLIEHSYNAYPHFTLQLRNCNWRLTRQRFTLIEAGLNDTITPPRPELQSKCLPDIIIDGLTVDAPFLLRPRLVHYRGNPSSHPVRGINRIALGGITNRHGKAVRISLSDKRVPLANPVSLMVTPPGLSPTSTTVINRL